MGLVQACSVPPSGIPADAGVDAEQDGGSDSAAPDLSSDAGAPDQAPEPDIFVPFEMALTVDKIPAAMNGSAPFTNVSGQSEPFRLTVPRHGFTVDVLYRGTRAKLETLKVVSDVDLGGGSKVIGAGTDLADRFSESPQGVTFKIPSDLALPTGTVTFSAEMSDGAKVLHGEVTVDVAERTFMLDPFRLKDTWLLVFSQDLYTITRSQNSNGQVVFKSVATSNGVPDFEEDLRSIGLGTAKMRPDAAATENLGVKGTNAITRTWVQQQLLETLRKVFLIDADGTTTPDSVGIAFVVEGEPGAPSLSSFTYQQLEGGEASKSFSAIGIGGGDTAKSHLGMAKIDYRNVRNEANTGPSYGVFTSKAIATVFDILETDPAIKLLAQTFFGDFIPELGKGGTPVGEHPLDATILAKGFDPGKATAAAAGRYNKLSFLVETLGRLTGALTAHEIGHSLGLVANGPPPHGLFGGEKNASFVGSEKTTSHHIDTPGFNLMQAGPGSALNAKINMVEYLGTPRFNELNLAYLQGRLLLLP
jgi:hypothetical protein